MLWLWRRLAAVALIGPLAREPPYPVGAALKIREREREREKDYLCKTKFILWVSEMLSWAAKIPGTISSGVMISGLVFG